MGSALPGEILFYGPSPDGPRLNKGVTSPDLQLKDGNILTQEQQIVQERLKRLKQTAEDLKFGDLKDSDWPSSLSGQLPLIGNKTISYEQLYSIIGQRFHKCLFEKAKEIPDLAD